MGRRMLLAVAVATGIVTCGAGAVAAPNARAEVEWLCKPGVMPDPCREDLTATIQDNPSVSRVQEYPLPAAPPVDCFYVYPTVSEQPGVNADKAKDPEVVAIARFQAQRFSQTCRVFAPVYRQLTLASIGAGTAEQRAAGFKIAYGDVLEAFRKYLAEDNQGRGIVLVGHSQGTRMLRKVLREEVDAKPEVRKRLVAAHLLGGNVLVRSDSLVGGDAQTVPACTAPEQFGCLIAFSAFMDTPPNPSRFGRPPAVDETNAGFPAGKGFEVLCTNPGSLGANARTGLQTFIRTDRFPGVIGAGLDITFGGPPPTVEGTPWLEPAEKYSGRCETINDARVLQVSPLGNARRLNPFPDPGWGIHLTDGNIALGQLVDLVGSQAAAYLAKPASRKVSARLSCSRGVLRAVLSGAGVRSVEVRRAGRVVARDRLAPFRVQVPRSARSRRGRTRLQLVALRDDGSRTTLTRVARPCR